METCEARALRIYGELWTCDQCGEEPWCDVDVLTARHEECTCGGNYVRTNALHGGWRWDPESNDWLWVHDASRQEAQRLFDALGRSARDIASFVTLSHDPDFVRAIAEIEDSGWRVTPRRTIMDACERRLSKLSKASSSDGE